MTSFRTILIVMAAAATLSLGAALPSAAVAQGPESCLSDTEIQSAIAGGQIKSWPKIRKLAQIPKDYRETSDIQVCLTGGVPYFYVSMVSPKGEYLKIVLNAVDGTPEVL